MAEHTGENTTGRTNSGAGPSRRWTPYLAVVPVLAVAGALIYGAVQLTGGGGAATPTSLPEDRSGGASTPQAVAVVEQITEAVNRYIETNDLAQARVVLDASLARQPGSDRLLRLDAELRFREGDAAGAYEAMDRAVTLGEDLPEYRFAAALYAMQAELYEHAETHLLKAQTDAPGNPKYAVYLGAIQYQHLGNALEAKTNLLLATRADDTLHQAWAMLAEIALAENKPGVGLQHIGRAVRLAPGVTAYQVTRSRLLRREGLADEAVAVMRSVPEREVLTSPVLLAELATALGMAGRPGEAADAYVRALERFGGDADVLYEAAVWLDRADRRDEAAVYAQRAAERGHRAASELAASWRDEPASPGVPPVSDAGG